MTRRLLAVVFAVLLVMAPPVAAAGFDAGNAYDSKLSKAAASVDSTFGFNSPDWLQTYGVDERPGFYVTYANDSFGSLEEWANESSDRRILDHDTGSRRVLVTAPAPAVYGGFISTETTLPVVDTSVPGATYIWGSSTLTARRYVERIDVAMTMRYAEPVTPGNESDVYEQPAPDSLVAGSFTTDGIAFSEDVDPSTMADVKQAIGADTASVDGSGVTVAVLDTGVNTHDGEVFGNGSTGSDSRISAARNFVTEEDATEANGFENVTDGDGHGTWVASAIAANASDDTYDGVAPGAGLLVGKVLADDGSGSTQDIVDGIEWADENGADVISMSLGSPTYSATIAEELEEALEGNVSMAVVAVGNSRMNPATRYISSPADVPHPGVVGVAASDTAVPENASVAYYSEVGPDGGATDLSRGVTAGEGPDVIAPGFEVTAMHVSRTGAKQTKTLSGTSMATPVVAGVMALEYEQHPATIGDANASRGWLLNTSSPAPRIGTTEAGHGMVNVTNLLAHNETEGTQADALTDAAASRDAANEATSGSQLVRIVTRATSFDFGGLL